MSLLKCEQHVAASCKQGDIPFTEEHHRLSTHHFSSESISRLMPGLTSGTCCRHHRKQQGQLPLAWTHPTRRNRGGQADDSLASDWCRHHISLLDRADGRDRQQLGITGANPDQRESGRYGRVDDGQLNGPPEG